MDDLFTSEVWENDQVGFTSEEAFEEATEIIFEETQPDQEREPSIPEQPYYNTESDLFGSELFTSQQQSSGSSGDTSGQVTIGQGSAGEDPQNHDGAEKEEISLLKAILEKIPEKNEEETEILQEEETTTTIEEATETTTDQYLYALDKLQGEIKQIQDNQVIAIKNENLASVATITLLSALLGALFISYFLGRLR